MLYGIRDNKKVKAEQTGDRATCPFTGSELIAKCGYIKMNHWAYKNAADGVDYKGETQWHLEWKSRFDAEHCEVLHKDKFGFNHIADVDNGSTVYEFQHSPISSLELIQRELFYTSIGKQFVWVLDGKTYINEGDTISESTHTLTVSYLSKAQREAISNNTYVRNARWKVIGKETTITYKTGDNDNVVQALKGILKDYQLESMEMELEFKQSTIAIQSRKSIYSISRSPIFIDISHIKPNTLYSVLENRTYTKQQFLKGN